MVEIDASLTTRRAAAVDAPFAARIMAPTREQKRNKMNIKPSLLTKIPAPVRDLKDDLPPVSKLVLTDLQKLAAKRLTDSGDWVLSTANYIHDSEGHGDTYCFGKNRKKGKTIRIDTDGVCQPIN